MRRGGPLDGALDRVTLPLDESEPVPQIKNDWLRLGSKILRFEFFGRLQRTKEIHGRIREFRYRTDALLEKICNLGEIWSGGYIAAIRLKKRLDQLCQPSTIGILQILLVEPLEFFRVEFSR